MDDLIAFLRARLDEDEQTARAATHAGAEVWRVSGDHSDKGGTYWRIAAPTSGPSDMIELVGSGMSGGGAHTVEVATHIARHDPARILRDVEAKRQMLELHGIVHRDIGWLENGEEEGAELPVCGHCVPRNTHYGSRKAVAEGPCATLRMLALPYSDHPDSRDDWRP